MAPAGLQSGRELVVLQDVTAMKLLYFVQYRGGLILVQSTATMSMASTSMLMSQGRLTARRLPRPWCRSILEELSFF